jgi:ATP-binding cassette subfamily F protein 3
MIQLSNVTKSYGTRALYKNGDVIVRPGDRIGLVGPNGAGKTTIFRLITGEELPDVGQVSIAPQTVIGYFSQDVGDMRGRTTLAEVIAGAGRVSELGEQIQQMEKQLENAADLSEEALAALVEKFGDAQAEFQTRGGYDLEARAKEVLTGLGIGPEDHSRPVEHFSGGWKMRIALAKILTLNPDVLLMDEPTNHLDIESILWLEEWLGSFKGSIVMTSHDREFLNRRVNRIVEIANSKITTYSGNYEFYLRERDLRFQQLVAAAQRQQEMLAKEEEFIAKFAARASHAAQVQSRVKKIEKIERIEVPAQARVVNFEFAEAPRSGNDVVRMTNLGKVWRRDDGSEKPVFSGISGVVQRLNKIAVTGVNGAGKSTLLKVIVGEAEATTGTAVIGAGVKIGYFSQHALDQLNSNQTIFEELSNRFPGFNSGVIRNLLGAFLFSGDDIEKKIGRLSGGEKSRVVLAIMLASPLNLLVLDEPTNHLDIESREVLLKALQKFEGTVLLVSHDRYFLRSIVNRVFEIDHGEMRTYEGDYDYYLSKKSTASA